MHDESSAALAAEISRVSELTAPISFDEVRAWPRVELAAGFDDEIATNGADPKPVDGLRLFSEAQPTPLFEGGERVEINVAVAESPSLWWGRDRSGRLLVLAGAAASVLLVVLLVSLFDDGGDKDDTIFTEDVEEPALPDPAPPVAPALPDPAPPVAPALPASQDGPAATAFTWTKSDYRAPTNAVFVSDGDQFFMIGSELHSSADGFTWESRGIENMPPVELLSGEFSVSDANAGRILHLVVRDDQATIYLFDLGAGVVHESVLPARFCMDGAPLEARCRPGTQYRGSVSLSDEGEALAILRVDSQRQFEGTERFYSADGVEWVAISEGQLPSDLTLETVALGDGFVAVGTNDLGRNVTRTFWHSPDGAAWQELMAGGLIFKLLSWSGTVIGYGETDFPEAYLLTESGSTELDIDVSTLGQRCNGPWTLVAGEFGLAALCPGNPSIGFSPDGINWFSQDWPALQRSEDPRHVAAGADRVLIKDDDEIWVGTL
jgi:hypothetical protein